MIVEKGWLLVLTIYGLAEPQGAVIAEENQEDNQCSMLGVVMMRIKFYHDSGWIELKAEYIVEYMRMTTFRKWAKMFAKFGTSEQHKEFLQFLVPYLGEAEEKCAELTSELTERQMKADGRLPTVMTHNYWEGEVKRYQSKLNGAKTKYKRYSLMHEILEGLVS